MLAVNNMQLLRAANAIDFKCNSKLGLNTTRSLQKFYVKSRLQPINGNVVEGAVTFLCNGLHLCVRNL